MDAWTKIVEDLQKVSSTPQPHFEKTFLQRMWNIVFKDGCSGTCNQGRQTCNCR